MVIIVSMAHIRLRYLQKPLQQVLKFSPIVGIIGHRQVGKTTVLESEVSRYVTLDQEKILIEAQTDPAAFLQKMKGLRLGIDEAQMAPKLFPALKERVRTNKSPGQFLISGSVRFSSRAAIRESLTGRIVNLELLPFSISELAQNEPTQFLIQLNKAKDLRQFINASTHQIQGRKKLDQQVDRYLQNGGLPGICFFRSPALKNVRISDQLATILDRDLRLVYPTSVPYIQLYELLSYLSKIEGQIIRYSEIRAQVGITEATQKKLLYALENIFLIRRIPVSGGEKGFAVFLEDQAESFFLNPKKDLQTQMESLVFRHVRVPFQNQLGENFRHFYYSTRSGARVPVAIETQDGILGFISTEDLKPNRSELAIANSFLKTYGTAKIVFLHRDTKVQVLNDRCVILPLHAIL